MSKITRGQRATMKVFDCASNMDKKVLDDVIKQFVNH